MERAWLGGAKHINTPSISRPCRSTRLNAIKEKGRNVSSLSRLTTALSLAVEKTMKIAKVRKKTKNKKKKGWFLDKWYKTKGIISYGLIQCQQV